MYKSTAKAGRFVHTSASAVKKSFTYRLFWGRSILYKRIIHFIVIGFTLIALVSGITSSYLFSNTNAQSRIQVAQSYNFGNIDLLEQGGNVEPVNLANSTANFRIIERKLAKGEDLQKIADEYQITKESLLLSNTDVIYYYDESFQDGATVRIPDINGVLIKAGENDNLDSIMTKVKEGNKVDVIEINQLKAPEYKIKPNSYVLIPDGLTELPPRRTPRVIYRPPTSNNTYANNNGINVGALNGITFVDPLSDPSCAGYGYSRGVSSWHNGVDLPKAGGCVTRAAAAGVVTYSGWEPYGGGWAVTIDHGNGVQTVYYHHSQLYVPVGTYVSAGQAIGYMGCTGLCTGTHLHLGLRINYNYLNPAPYIPYRR